MIDLVGKVTSSLVNANTQSKLGGHALGIYETAKAKNDMATMDRAMGYANDALKEAQKEIVDISKDLKKAVEDASAEQKKKEEEEKVDPQDIVEISADSNSTEINNVNNQEKTENSEKTVYNS